MESGVWNAETELKIEKAYLKKPVEDSNVSDWCATTRSNGKFASSKDQFGNLFCDFYKSISFHVADAGSFVGSFLIGLLDLSIDVNGHLKSFGKELVFGDEVKVAIPMDLWPDDAVEVKVKNIRFNGKLVNLLCKKTDNNLSVLLTEASK